jgi:hypothetical protein
MPAFENGLRPGLQGQTLVSTGLADLDKILGGGLPLESVLLILDDGYTPHAATLLRYFLAEGAACGHSCLLATPEASFLSNSNRGAVGIAAWLPREGRPSASQVRKGYFSTALTAFFPSCLSPPSPLFFNPRRPLASSSINHICVHRLKKRKKRTKRTRPS